MPTTVEQLQYGFDRDSRRTWRQRATTQGWDNAYVYDSLSQVIGDDRGDQNLAHNAIAGVPSNGSRWQYDETGNWHGYEMLTQGAATLTQSRTHDKGNRLMEVSDAAAMRTDRAGRMTEAVPGPTGDWNSSWTVKWDAWSRIVELESQGISAAYAYDGLARRISRYTNLDDVTLHSYYNDEWRPVEDRRNAGTSAEASYLWGVRHRDDLVRRDRATTHVALNETRYILMDYFSPAAITDESGNVTERYQFSAFGLRTILNPDFTVRSASECAMEFSFQGQFEDVETGWMNYGYRYYLPALGRWSCKDPIAEEGGINLYAMAANCPINWVDVFGLEPLLASDFVGPPHIFTSSKAAAINALDEARKASIASDTDASRTMFETLVARRDKVPRGYFGDEQCGLICKQKCPSTGDDIFVRTGPVTATKDKGAYCDPHQAPCPDGWEEIDRYHTHPDNAPPSNDDYILALPLSKKGGGGYVGSGNESSNRIYHYTSSQNPTNGILVRNLPDVIRP